LAGFVSGEGSFFFVRVKKAETPRSVNRVSFIFTINQHSRDNLLITNFSKYLNCGTIFAKLNYISFTVSKFEDIESKIIPFFQKYPLQGIKRSNFEDFCEIMKLVQSKAHLTPEGFDKIHKIKDGMDFGRK
jgi:hypothetical protein